MDSKALEYLSAEKTLTLATYSSDGPWAATLTYVNDGLELYVWMQQGSTTARNLHDDPTVAFTIDEYTEDWRQTKGMQGRGTCNPVTGAEIAKVAELFGEKFPDLRPGATSAVTFFKITPDTLHLIDNSSAVTEAAEGAEYRRESLLDLLSPEET